MNKSFAKTGVLCPVVDVYWPGDHRRKGHTGRWQSSTGRKWLPRSGANEYQHGTDLFHTVELSGSVRPGRCPECSDRSVLVRFDGWSSQRTRFRASEGDYSFESASRRRQYRSPVLTSQDCALGPQSLHSDSRTITSNRSKAVADHHRGWRQIRFRAHIFTNVELWRFNDGPTARR